MKKTSLIIVSLLAILSFGIINADAQTRFYLGGQAGFNLSGTTDDGIKASTFSFNPEFGVQVGRRWMFGTELNFNAVRADNSRKELTIGDVTFESTEDMYAVGISPYARYKFARIRRVGLWVEGSASFYKMFDSEGDIDATVAGLNVLPMVTYEPSRHIVLYSTINLFSLNCTYTRIDAVTNVSSDQYSFGFNADATSLAKTGDISIGLLYRF